MTQAPTDPTQAAPLITVDVWTDVVCPWCYIGESRLHDAIEAEGLTGQVHLRAHSFELDPTSPVTPDQDNIEHLVRAKGLDADQVRQMESQIKEMAAEIGREYVTDRPMANTRGVHRVMQALSEAKGADAATEFFMQLQRGYFTGALDPFDADVAVTRAVEAGLAEETARAAHEGRSHDDKVDAEVREAASMGARGVPFFLFNDKYTAPGALPMDAFRQALRQIADEARAERGESADAGAKGTEGEQA